MNREAGSVRWADDMKYGYGGAQRSARPTHERSLAHYLELRPTNWC